jgi:hypothetical protein
VGIAGLRDHGTVVNRNRMNSMARLDDAGPTGDYG